MHAMSVPLTSKAISCVIIAGFWVVVQTPEVLAEGFSVNQVIEAIKSEINSARLASSKQEEALEITSVDIILTAVAKYDGQAGIKLEIPIVEKLGRVVGNVGGKVANTQTISLTLIPEGGAVQVQGSANLGLLPAIESVKSAMRMAAGGEFRLRLQAFEFEVQYAVTKTAEGQIRFLFIDTEVAYENLAIQRIKIHMKPKK